MKDAAEIIERVLYAISFEPVVTEDQIMEVAALAEIIWHEHYDTIIGQNQVNYMINKFQSESAMKEQMAKESFQYFKMVNLGGFVGYLAIREDPGVLFLSKIYIVKKYRGRDYARKAMNYLEQLCSDRKLNKIWLTVNRFNETTIKIYESLGFIKTGMQMTDIGSGFVMDDYIMEISI